MSREPSSTSIPQEERGYILVTAVWLLLLGASIVALIMLKNLNRSEELGFERQQVRVDDAKEGALETAIADLIFNGSDSQFAFLPARTEYEIDNFEISVKANSEHGKIDLNQADPEMVRRALQGLGISRAQREAFVLSMMQRRERRIPLRSGHDVRKIFFEAGIIPRDEFCANLYFTVFSGQTQPQASQMDPRLARALGEVVLANSDRARAGTPIRFEISTRQGRPLVAVVRISGLLDKSHEVMDWGSLACVDRH